MTHNINVYYHERCGECGDIRRALKRHDIHYQGHYYPPKDPQLKIYPENSDTNSYKSSRFKPVLIHEEIVPDGVIGHEKILEWIEEHFEE